ncbi:hypothetical protein Micbo1qcDRAFT_207808 [Microdochium bolleyi]|uniref:Rhodopsin domain-containing protein n=1 Tax=Microdochium bolleyi TaxID=196109 RepID=A0A136ITA8_9PEZI|nr:hypothetical protein Micbo1qcDRAFT_207808 [Microdochium bolleyi]
MVSKSVFEFVSAANFGEPTPWSNTKPALVGVPIVFLTMAWVCVLSRLYTRFFLIRSPWWDDLCVFLYALFTTAATVAVIKAADHGLGQHFLKLTVSNMQKFLMYFYIINGAYATSTAIIKIALLLQYLRIFKRGTGIYRFTILILILTALWGFVYSVIAWVPCQRPSKYWSLALDETCYGFASTDIPQLVATYESHTGINMALDFILLAIPLQLFWAEGQTRLQRLRLLGIFSLGAICIVFAAWRLAVLIRSQVGTFPVFDPTWYSGLGILLALMEVNCAAICGSVPIFWPQLSARIGNIIVVREVKITTESRLENTMDDNDNNSGRHQSSRSRNRSIQLEDDDNYSAFSKRIGAVRHPDESEGSVYRLRQDSSSTFQMDEIDAADKRRKHYQDTYIMDQVDPLRGVKSQTVTTVEHR